jgi:hypothetical protein
MLDDPVARQKLARQWVKESDRPIDGDPLSALNPLDVKFFRNGRVNVQIPIIDPVDARRCLLFLANEIPALLAEMDSISSNRTKSLLVMSKLKAWNQAFGRGLGHYTRTRLIK